MISRSTIYRRKKRAATLGCSVDELPDARGKHGHHARGEASGRYKPRGSKHINSDGYIKVLVGKDHPLADRNGHAYEHIMVWTQANGDIPDEFVVHHRDGNRANNSLENLELMCFEDHSRMHSNKRRDPATGRFGGHPDKRDNLDDFPLHLRIRQMPER